MVHSVQLVTMSGCAASIPGRLWRVKIKRQKSYCLLFQYINHGDLEQLLANHSIELPWTTRVHIAQDVAAGMAYLHEQRGIMHRDLTSKVGNSLVSVKL